MPIDSGNNFDFGRAEALTKYVYAGKEEDLAPESDKTAKEFEFVPAAQQVGRKFLMPVEPNRSLGVTFNNTGSVFDLNKSRAPEDLTAEIMGTEILVRESMSYAMMNRAMKGDTRTKAGLKAFVQATSHTFKRLSKGGSYFREVTMLYGGGPNATTALGTVTATTGSSGTTLVVTLDASDWATALWTGSEGGAFDIYSSAGVKRNSAGSGETSVFVLNSVNTSTYQLTFSSDSTNVAAVQVGDKIYFEGQRTKDCLGLQAAASETTLWNISTTDWRLWKPQTVNIGGQATFESLMEGAVRVGDIGFNGRLNVHMSLATFKDIADDQAALVRYAEKSKGKVEIGFDSITFYGPTGSMALKPNIYVKRGLAFGFPEGHCKRVGSTDLTYSLPGYGKMLRELENAAGVEARIYSDQAPFIDRPGFFVLYTGITNSAD